MTVEQAFARWQAARSEHEAARLALVAEIRKAVDRGTPQSEVARTLGWPRQRISKLLA